MTTIAYRDGFMAGDSQRSFGGFVVRDAVKVHRLGDKLYGFCGSAVRADEFLAAVKAGEPWPEIGSFDDGEPHLVVLIASRDGGLVRLASMGPEALRLPYFATGADADVAMGALHAGASAAHAVRAACDHGCHSGGPVRVVSFDD